ncbi:uncharacterized protein HHUB_2211 [Halobacterium hubeiense]|uniref:Uncharacterized protein n=1 Tax=Halobacterium hubeiense TaxID=1407499 RepID=A0A0U5H4P3_9EURY|nr:uncharacterized protein HHUB_2211 [Halobacterium hubeiense]
MSSDLEHKQDEDKIDLLDRIRDCLEVLRLSLRVVLLILVITGALGHSLLV